MIERLIENWLTNLSERKNLDIPFRLLLEAEGHRVNGHRTIHGPMELGKDVVSWYPCEQRYYFFQLKSGDVTQNDWLEMERQMLLMAEVPYVHPNYQPGDPYQSVWVCTGQLHETVRIGLGLKNDEARRQGKPTIEVWDRSTLVKKFRDAFFHLLFVDDPFAVDFLKRWSQALEYLADEEELRLFFHNYLFALVGQLTIGLQTRMAAPEPANRRRRARSRRLRRLPFQTKGVGSAFQPATVCSNHSMTC